jgi:dTDP-3-amino-3,4,6-trideoxy-alpha-D-glucose transaminase
MSQTAIPFLDLSAETAALRHDLDAAWARVRDGNALILGPELRAFEAEFAALCGVPHALGVGNGLDAISLALRALGIGPGDEVIVPAHTFVATWLAVMAVGAVPVACEPLQGSYNISAESARPLITPRTRAIIAVHLYGHPADPAALAALCAEKGLALIEDAAQAHGATSGGRTIGSFGRIGCFSFYPTKNLGALGDGGAVVTEDPALAESLALLRNYGAREKYHTDVIGTNSRLDELQAAVLRVKLAHYPRALADRRRVAARYLDGLAGVPGLALPRTPPGDAPVWHLFVVRTAARDALRAHLSDQGIGTGLHYPVPVYRNPPFLAFAPAGETETDRISAQVLSLPFWPALDAARQDRVIAAIRDFFGG